MAQNDIYGNKERYERYVYNIAEYCKPFKDRKILNAKTLKQGQKNQFKYTIRNKDNIKHFKRLFDKFESQDLSYIRRNRLTITLLLVCDTLDIDLMKAGREDIDKVIARFRKEYNSTSQGKAIEDLKKIWKTILPDNDEKGRPDETLSPYVVRHVSSKIDRSRQTLKDNTPTFEEAEQILNYFNNEPRIQAYLSLIYFSYARPQEVSYLKFDNINLYDNFAKVYVSEHGKEGVKLVQVIDAFPYVAKWYSLHPYKKGYFFVNTGRNYKSIILSPINVNKFLRTALKRLNIKKKISCYSFKRGGITNDYLAGADEVEIQKRAGWTSVKMLHSYDMSGQEEAFKVSLMKRGLLAVDDKHSHLKPKSKSCFFCKTINALTAGVCSKCDRPLDREKIKQESERMVHETAGLKEQMANMQKAMDLIMRHVVKGKGTSAEIEKALKKP